MPVSINGSTGAGPQIAGFLVGQVAFFAMTTPPAGFLVCNGQAVSRTTYAALFAAIGTTYGAGDGSTTFNLPDLRGEFIRGWDAGRGVDAGRTFGSAQAHAMKDHTHRMRMYGAGFTFNNGGANYRTTYTMDGNNDFNETGWGSESTVQTGWFSSETRPRNVALLACIFAGV